MADIPNGEILFRYANPAYFPPDQEEIPTSIFEDHDLSCDWELYQKAPQDSPHVTEGRSRLISIRVCDEIRNPTNPRGVLKESAIQEILHDPLSENDDFGPNESHSLIRGNKKKEATRAICRNSTWRDL